MDYAVSLVEGDKKCIQKFDREISWKTRRWQANIKVELGNGLSMSTHRPHSYLGLMESFCVSGVEPQILLCNNWLANYQCVVCFQVICHDSINSKDYYTLRLLSEINGNYLGFRNSKCEGNYDSGKHYHKPQFTDIITHLVAWWIKDFNRSKMISSFISNAVSTVLAAAYSVGNEMMSINENLVSCGRKQHFL